MLYIGIDVGAKGALSYVNSSGHLYTSIKFDLRKYIELFEDIKDFEKPQTLIVGVEKVNAMPNQGVKSMFSFGQRLGELEGVLQTLKIPYELIPPRVWQKSCNIKPKSKKQDIANEILKLYPNASLRGGKGGLLDGVADSIGIAHHMRLKYRVET